MIKYAKVEDEITKVCSVGTGTNAEFYQSIGMTEQDVEQAYNGGWYLKGYAPEKPQPTEEEIANSVRSERDNRLNQTNWLVERHQEQLTLGSTTLSSEEYLALLAYRQALRDVPQQEGFPNDIQWPEELPFLKLF